MTTPQSIQSSGVTGQHNSSSISPAPKTDGQGPKATRDQRHIIGPLFHACLEVLRRAIIDHPAHKSHFEAASYHLSLWGSGLFSGPISIDQALDQESDVVVSLKSHVAGTLADIAITLEHLLHTLGESVDSTSILKLQAIFAIPKISDLLTKEISEADDLSNIDETTPGYCFEEISELIKCLFCTLPTIELIFKTLLAQQSRSLTTDEREMSLPKPESIISHSSTDLDHVKDVLKEDLEHITTMRQSLRNAKLVGNMEDGKPASGAK